MGKDPRSSKTVFVCFHVGTVNCVQVSTICLLIKEKLKILLFIALTICAKQPQGMMLPPPRLTAVTVFLGLKGSPLLLQTHPLS